MAVKMRVFYEKNHGVMQFIDEQGVVTKTINKPMTLAEWAQERDKLLARGFDVKGPSN